MPAATALSPFHRLHATLLHGGDFDFASLAGQLVLVANTASRCGFTPQYAGLEALYQRYRADGFTILAFPCNQFGHQEPGGAADIARTCEIDYGVSFPVFARVQVNGPAADPLFRLLKRALPGPFGPRIWWNFTKFLVGPDGRPLRRFAPLTPPRRIEPAVRAALGLR